MGVMQIANGIGNYNGVVSKAKEKKLFSKLRKIIWNLEFCSKYCGTIRFDYHLKNKNILWLYCYFENN